MASVRITSLTSLARPSSIRALGLVIGLLIGIAVAVPFLFSINPTSPDWAVPLVIVPAAGLLAWLAAEPTARGGWRSGVVAAFVLTPVSLVVAGFGLVVRSAVAPLSDPNASVGLALFGDVLLNGPAWLTMFLLVIAWLVAFRGALRILSLV